ncbi:MAG: serine/threonine protein kinase, partial [Nonomuraea sp.]|nr:serine/threonine protein kinase [Nonomuraea sp.]
TQTAQETEEPDPQPENLLTPAGIRAAIKTLKPVMGGSKVVRMVIYPTYASADAPVKGDATIYDTFSYRNGTAARFGTGGTVSTPAVDLEKFNWDALPALLKKAETSLRVPKPTARYLIVDSDSMFTGSRQALLVYVSDEYHRTGYLVADVRGRVVRLQPSS